MVEGFLFFYAYLFVSVGCCPRSDLYRFVKLWYESELTEMYLDLSPSHHPFNRSMLTKHCRCFDTDTQGADGAADLLQALRSSPLLEELDFDNCFEIPAAAWQQLPDGAWPKLRMTKGIPEEELRRLRGQRGELEGRTEGDLRRHDPREGREEEDQR